MANLYQFDRVLPSRIRFSNNETGWVWDELTDVNHSGSDQVHRLGPKPDYGYILGFLPDFNGPTGAKSNSKSKNYIY